jgi:8-oxo-dGTP pyrophosphatase MutT (NUDIX family)
LLSQRKSAGAGRLCFPCGTPDPSDLNARGSFDLTKHLSRELREETGIGIDELDAQRGWALVRDRCYVALIRRLISRENAHELRRRVMRHIAGEQQPELSDIHVVHGSNAKVRDSVSAGAMAAMSSGRSRVRMATKKI